MYTKYIGGKFSWNGVTLFTRLYISWFTKHIRKLIRQRFCVWRKMFLLHWSYQATWDGISSTPSVLFDSIRYACFQTYTWLGSSISRALLHNGAFTRAFLRCFQMQEFRHVIDIYTCAYINFNGYQLREQLLWAQTITQNLFIVRASVGI